VVVVVGVAEGVVDGVGEIGGNPCWFETSQLLQPTIERLNKELISVFIAE
jgi:hypothetical protein